MYRDYPLTGSGADFMYKVYSWMAAALALTAGVAYAVYSTPMLFALLVHNLPVIFLLFMGQFCLVLILSSMIHRLSFKTAAVIFISYAILNGITLSTLFFVYTMSSIYLTFGVSAGMFGIMAMYGYYAQEDLTALGNIAFMGLIGIILASLVNFFVGSSAIEYILSLVGVGVFTILTAYDSQKLKNLGVQLMHHGEAASKAALIGALDLYLDFLNLFLFMLRLLGTRKR